MHKSSITLCMYVLYVHVQVRLGVQLKHLPIKSLSRYVLTKRTSQIKQQDRFTVFKINITIEELKFGYFYSDLRNPMPLTLIM